MSQRHLVIAIILAATTLIISGSVWFFLEHMEQREGRIHIGYQGEAQRNPFLAAGALLESMAMPTHFIRTLNDLPTLPGERDTLLLNTPGYSMTGERAQRFLDWVRRGGHLILVPHSEYDEDRHSNADPFLDELGVRAQKDRYTGEADKEDYLVEVTLDSDGESIQVHFDPDWHLTTPSEDSAEAFWAVDGDQGTHLLQFTFGRGLVTVLSDFKLLHQPEIGQHDHAQFWWDLLHVDDRQGEAWIQYLPVAPSIWKLMREYAWAILLSTLIWLLCWLWWRLYRLGPLQYAPPIARRSLLEHVMASGKFLWARKQDHVLLAETRYSLRRHIEQRHPGWQHLEEEQRYVMLAELSNLSPQQIQQALQTDIPHHKAHEFTKTLQLLASIRKNL